MNNNDEEDPIEIPHGQRKPHMGICGICQQPICKPEHLFEKFFLCIKCITQEKMHVWCYCRSEVVADGNDPGLQCLNTSDNEKHYVSPNMSLWNVKITNIPPSYCDNDKLATATTYREALRYVDETYTTRPDPLGRFVLVLLMLPLCFAYAVLFVIIRLVYAADPRLVDRVYWCINGVSLLVCIGFIWRNAKNAANELKKTEKLDDYSCPLYRSTKLGSKFTLWMEALLVITSATIPILVRFGFTVIYGAMGMWVIEVIIIAYGCGKDIENFTVGARRYVSRRNVLWFLYRRTLKQIARTLGVDIRDLERSTWVESEIDISKTRTTRETATTSITPTTFANAPQIKKDESDDANERLAAGLHSEMREMKRIDRCVIPKMCGIPIVDKKMCESWNF